MALNYYNLKELPLFAGMTNDELHTIIARYHLGRIEAKKGALIVREGTAADRILLLIDGTMIVQSTSQDGSFTLQEHINAPETLQCERLFGLLDRHTRTFMAATDCFLLSVPKADVVRLMSDFEIFRINYLNIVCTLSQRLSRILWRTRPTRIMPKIVDFVLLHSLKSSGRKELRIKMQDLAFEIGESRLNVSRALKLMEQSGDIELHRQKIVVLALERLLG